MFNKIKKRIYIKNTGKRCLFMGILKKLWDMLPEGRPV